MRRQNRLLEKCQKRWKIFAEVQRILSSLQNALSRCKRFGDSGDALTPGYGLESHWDEPQASNENRGILASPTRCPLNRNSADFGRLFQRATRKEIPERSLEAMLNAPSMAMGRMLSGIVYLPSQSASRCEVAATFSAFCQRCFNPQSPSSSATKLFAVFSGSFFTQRFSRRNGGRDNLSIGIRHGVSAVAFMILLHQKFAKSWRAKSWRRRHWAPTANSYFRRNAEVITAPFPRPCSSFAETWSTLVRGIGRFADRPRLDHPCSANVESFMARCHSYWAAKKHADRYDFTIKGFIFLSYLFLSASR